MLFLVSFKVVWLEALEDFDDLLKEDNYISVIDSMKKEEKEKV